MTVRTAYNNGTSQLDMHLQVELKVVLKVLANKNASSLF
jgi:hypothetical protein